MMNQSSDPNLLRGKLCPHLGVEDDRETALSFPSEHNCCFHVKPPARVNLVQQREYCLSIKYTSCPIYSGESAQKLPEGWGKKKTIEFKPKPGMLAAIVVFLVCVVILVSFLLGLFNKPETPAISLPTVTPTTMVFMESPTSETGNIPVATETLAPIVTEVPPQPTDIQPHMLEIVFSTNPQLLVHRIQEGEGFIMLAEKYQTSVDAIKAINYELTDSLLYNQIIVLPVNSTDVANLPSFSVYQEQEGNVSIEELADRMKIDVVSFRTYNDLPEGYIVSPGEWLLIPH